jgi:hypothetical protein
MCWSFLDHFIQPHTMPFPTVMPVSSYQHISMFPLFKFRLLFHICIFSKFLWICSETLAYSFMCFVDISFWHAFITYSNIILHLILLY